MGEYSGAFVAFDVAKTKHAVAVAEAGRAGEVRFLGEVENTPAGIERTIKKLAARYGRLQVCFEAGPTGYGLDRQIQELGWPPLAPPWCGPFTPTYVTAPKLRGANPTGSAFALSLVTTLCA